MKLVQIARKLNVSPSEIATYLQTEMEGEIDVSPSFELDEEWKEKIIDKYESIEEELPPQKEFTVDEVIPFRIAQLARKIHRNPKEIIDFLKTKLEQEGPFYPNTELSKESSCKALNYFLVNPYSARPLIVEEGVIKAPKVSVEGVKVLGKIELPKEKKREGKQTQQKKEHSKHKKGRKRKTVSYEERVKREKRQVQRELAEKRKREKAKKRAHYERKIKSMKVHKPKRKAASSQQQRETEVQRKDAQNKKTPTSVWGKFVAWLNGE